MLYMHTAWMHVGRYLKCKAYHMLYMHTTTLIKKMKVCRSLFETQICFRADAESHNSIRRRVYTQTGEPIEQAEHPPQSSVTTCLLDSILPSTTDPEWLHVFVFTGCFFLHASIQFCASFACCFTSCCEGTSGPPLLLLFELLFFCRTYTFSWDRSNLMQSTSGWDKLNFSAKHIW